MNSFIIVSKLQQLYPLRDLDINFLNSIRRIFLFEHLFDSSHINAIHFLTQSILVRSK